MYICRKADRLIAFFPDSYWDRRRKVRTPQGSIVGNTHRSRSERDWDQDQCNRKNVQVML